MIVSLRKEVTILIKIGIDLGANSIRLISIDEGIIFNEPCMVAIDEHNHVLAIGNEAFEMKGLQNDQVRVISPISNNKIDISALTSLLEQLCYQFKIFRFFVKTTILFSYPTSLSSEDCELVKNALINLGADKVYYDQEIWFAAIGSRLNLSSSVAGCVMNIGYSNCDIAIFRQGEIIHYSLGPLAGIQLGKAIRSWLKKVHNMNISDMTLEQIIRTLGTVNQEADPFYTTISGSHIKTHALITLKISSNDIAFILAPLFKQLSNWVLGFLTSLPIETQKDIFTRGIVCSGGILTLQGATAQLQKSIGCPIHLTDNPLYTIINGLEIVLKQMDA